MTGDDQIPETDSVPWFLSSGGEESLLNWRAFHLGLEPGIHPSRWSAEIDAELRDLLSSDPRSVSILFGNVWNPSWHRDPDDRVVSLLLERPSLIPRIHLLLAAAAGRDLLPKLISSKDRRHLSEFLGADILELAHGRMTRWKLPDLTTWIPSWSGEVTADLSRAGGMILSGALATAPEAFRDQVMLCLPASASHGPLPTGSDFGRRCGEFLLAVARLAGLIPDEETLAAAA
jgi:hypothetical protein